MRKTTKIIAAFILLVLSCVVATAPVTKAAGQAAGKVFMWKVRPVGSGPSNPVWLLGSVHMADSSIYPLDDRIVAAFAASRTLAVEADISNPAALLKIGDFLQSGLYPENDSLERHVSAATLARMTALGLDMREYGRLRPWLAALNLTKRNMQALGYDASLGLDLYFLNEAGRRGMPVVELEGLERQIRIMSELSNTDEDAFLSYTLDEYSRMDKVARELFSAWKRGDAETLNALITRGLTGDARYRVLYDVLFTRRNTAMADKVAGFLKRGGSVFVVVGAGHLVGEGGLVRRLQAMGYVVEQQ